MVSYQNLEVGWVEASLQPTVWWVSHRSTHPTLTKAIIWQEALS